MHDMALSTNGVTDPSAARAPVRLRTMRAIGLLLSQPDYCGSWSHVRQPRPDPTQVRCLLARR